MDKGVSARSRGRCGQTGKKYLESPDGLEQREEAIFDQLARLECYGPVSEGTDTWCELVWMMLTVRSRDKLVCNVCGYDGLAGDLGRRRLIVQV